MRSQKVKTFSQKVTGRRLKSALRSRYAQGKAWYAGKEDVQAGSTPQANAKPIPLSLSGAARQRGIVRLYRSVPTVYQKSALESYLKQQVYDGESLMDIFELPPCRSRCRRRRW
jgi:hypothetical protein